MTERTQRDSVPPESECLLAARLNEWATRQALSPLRAESIRQSILGTAEVRAEDFSFAWWNRLFQDITASIKQTTDVRRYVDIRRVVTISVSV